ncbi:cobalamin B12-binding domain-containing protein [candidate division WOR-3 bacterium]|nr:cobalamin B12-binding domain-containing protein [candidate division WOR-3 bacterium]
MSVQPGVESVAALRKQLPELVERVNEKFRVDERFECGPIPCELAVTVEDLQYRFGRTLLAGYEFGLPDWLAPEFVGLVGPVMARGARAEFPRAMLDAWLVALRTTLPSATGDELALPLAELRAGLPGQWPADEPASLAGDAGEFFRLIRERRRREAAAFLARRAGGGDPSSLFDELVVPALARVGELWARNRLSAAEEHGATEVCRYAVLRVLDSVEPGPRTGVRALVACAPGEEHELGAEMVAGLVELAGGEVFFIGRSAPEAEIVAAARRFEPAVALLSSTTVATLPGLRDLARALRAALPDLRLVAGGSAAVLARARLAADCDRVVRTAAEGQTAVLELAR